MNARAATAALSLAAVLSGCATLQPTIRPEDTHLSGYVEQREPPPRGLRSLRVTTSSGEEIELRDPYRHEGHYVGWTHRSARGREHRKVPVDSIVQYRYFRHRHVSNEEGIANLIGLVLDISLDLAADPPRIPVSAGGAR